MNFGGDNRLDELAAEYRRLREAAMEAQHRMQTATATATSTKGLVTAVVGAQGELQELKFHSRSYRDLPPAELAHVILDTVRRARESVLRDVMAVLPGNLPGGLSPDDMLRGRVDLSGLLPEDLPVEGLPFVSPSDFNRGRE